MVWVWLAACGWLFSEESEDPQPAVVGASLGSRPKPPDVPRARPSSERDLAQLDQLFVRSTELVREGEPGAFEGATITFVQANLEEAHPGEGEMLTVVPAVEGLEPRSLKVVEVTEAELFVQMTTSTTDDPAWLAAPAPAGDRPEMLGRATVIHPVVPAAQRGAIPADLPEAIVADTVVAGVDVTGDGFADIVTSEHCCDDVSRVADDACSGGACVATWARTEGGWRVCEEE